MQGQGDRPASVVELRAPPPEVMGHDELRRWAVMPKARRDQAFRIDPDLRHRWKTSVKWYHSLPKSPARQFYDTPELRSRVLSLLARRELVSFMGVEKQGMFLVACELYKTVTYDRLVKHFSSDSPRKAMYCSAVSHVIVTSTQSDSGLLGIILLDTRAGRHVSGPKLLQTYRLDVFKLFVPKIKAGQCAEFLLPGLLERRGAIQTLRVYTASHPTVLFNLPRFLSCLCTKGVWLTVGGNVKREQTDYLRHLRNRSSIRRHHLSTINFPSLGVNTYQQVKDLSYHSDGRPRTLGESRARKWLNEKRRLGDFVDVDVFPSFDDGMYELARAASRFRDASIRAGPLPIPAETLVVQAAVEGLYQAADQAEQMVRDMRRLGDTVSRSLGTGTGEEENRRRHWMKRADPAASRELGRR